MKCGPPSSPQIWQGTVFLCQAGHGNADADASAADLPWHQLGPGSLVGQCCPAGDKGALLGWCLLVTQDREGAAGPLSPSTATPPPLPGECPPWLTLPLHDSPLHMVQGGSLPEVLGVLGLPDCPEGRKKWDHCRNEFSPVGAGSVPRESRPRQCQQLL